MDKRSNSICSVCLRRAFKSEPMNFLLMGDCTQKRKKNPTSAGIQPTTSLAVALTTELRSWWEQVVRGYGGTAL